MKLTPSRRAPAPAGARLVSFYYRTDGVPVQTWEIQKSPLSRRIIVRVGQCDLEVFHRQPLSSIAAEEDKCPI